MSIVKYHESHYVGVLDMYGKYLRFQHPEPKSSSESRD